MKLTRPSLSLLLWTAGMLLLPQAALASVDGAPAGLRHAPTLSLSPDARVRVLPVTDPAPEPALNDLDADLLAAVRSAFGIGDEVAAPILSSSAPVRVATDLGRDAGESRSDADRAAIALALVSIADFAQDAGVEPVRPAPGAPQPEAPVHEDPVAIERRTARSAEPSPDQHTSLLQPDLDAAEPAPAGRDDPATAAAGPIEKEPSAHAVLADLAELLGSGDETRPARVDPAVIAPEPRARAASPFGSQDEVVAVGADRLDGVRGGFETPAGMQIAFGIERAVYINGNLVTTTSLNVSGGRASTGAGALPSLPVPGGASLGAIQVGSGNSVVTSTLGNAAALGAVIQNTLNGQAIQSRTVINASTNSLQVMRSSGLQSSLRGVLIDSLRR